MKWISLKRRSLACPCDHASIVRKKRASEILFLCSLRISNVHLTWNHLNNIQQTTAYQINFWQYSTIQRMRDTRWQQLKREKFTSDEYKYLDIWSSESWWVNVVVIALTDFKTMPVSCFTPGNEDIVGDCLCKFFFILRFLFHIFFCFIAPRRSVWIWSRKKLLRNICINGFKIYYW